MRCFHSLNRTKLYATTSQWLTEPDPSIDFGNVGDIISVYISVMETTIVERKGEKNSGSFDAELIKRNFFGVAKWQVENLRDGGKHYKTE